MLGKIEGRRRRGLTEDEMVGWHHLLNGHKFERALGDGEGQGSLVCCSPWGCKESDMTEQLNTTTCVTSYFLLCHYSQCLMCPSRNKAYDYPIIKTMYVYIPDSTPCVYNYPPPFLGIHYCTGKILFQTISV